LRNIIFSMAIIPSLLLSLGTQASCGSAFCMLNTNWSTQGVWTQAGARVDLRYEYVNQDELRSGAEAATAEEIADMHHREVATVNHNIIATFDYAFNETYGISVNAPVVSREHSHTHHSHTQAGVIETSEWDFTKIGDVRVVGRVQLSPNDHLYDTYGINVGLKLPTGAYDVANDQGKLAERSMQPGTGTTDAIAGAYYSRRYPHSNSQWFSQILLSAPLQEREQFKGGKQMSVDLGYRYSASENIKLLAQLNYLVKQHDEGAEAEPEESASKTFVFNPGFSVAFNKSTQMYFFISHRLYQDVDSVQLSAKDGFVVGLSARF
jgi:hypothetical protein